MQKIIKVDGSYNLGKDICNQNISDIFDFIFEKKVWCNQEQISSKSGLGSTLEYTALYRDQLENFLESFGENVTIFDAPCGDLAWIRHLKNFKKITYIGGDVSPRLIESVKKQYEDINVFSFDICKDPFPSANIWHCRHCLIHLSIGDICKALKNFCESTIDFALTTTHHLPDNTTFDIPSGSFRPLDLHNYPFELPKAYYYLLDSDIRINQTQYSTGVWTRTQINQALRKHDDLWRNLENL